MTAKVMIASVVVRMQGQGLEEAEATVSRRVEWIGDSMAQVT